MIAAGGLTLDDIFARVRLRASDVTQGAEIRWYASQIQGPFFLTERLADAPPAPNFVPLAEIRTRLAAKREQMTRRDGRLASPEEI